VAEPNRSWQNARSWEELVAACRPLVTDVSFPTVEAWKGAHPDGKAIACFPVYTPQEVLAAAGALPVTLYGARGQVEIDHADSRIQSFVCSIARSTLELGLGGRAQSLDGLIVPSICDVARNLSGVWQRNFPGQFVFYLHLPQSPESPAAVTYYRGELERLRREVGEWTGCPPTDDALRGEIQIYNRNRELLDFLHQRRVEAPEQWPSAEVYVLAAVGNVLPRAEHNALLEKALQLGAVRQAPQRDAVRVLLRGAFCEQPPLELLEVLEEAGCAVVNDDLQVGSRFLLGPIRADGDPLAALAEAYLRQSVLTPVNHPGKRSRSADLLERVRATAAQGVIFASPKFCEPALYDSVLLKQALERAGTPYLEFEYEEKMTVFETVRVQAETFVESILFFS